MYSMKGIFIRNFESRLCVRVESFIIGAYCYAKYDIVKEVVNIRICFCDRYYSFFYKVSFYSICSTEVGETLEDLCSRCVKDYKSAIIEECIRERLKNVKC